MKDDDSKLRKDGVADASTADEGEQLLEGAEDALEKLSHLRRDASTEVKHDEPPHHHRHTADHNAGCIAVSARFRRHCNFRQISAEG